MNQTGPDASCPVPGLPDPLGIVIFGASGDLTSRKLLPALYNLFLVGALPEQFFLAGASRTDFSDDEFRARMQEAVEESGGDLSRWDGFARRLHYQEVDYREADDFRKLAGRLAELDREHGVGGCRLFNLAVPPSLYATVAGSLGLAGLSREDPERGAWARLVVEKPFGHDLATARELSRAIGASFNEHQVFRIDHYMAKETVQNILIFRFANAIFEPIWNRQYIRHVDIAASETLGVEHRAGYYEEAGVLRDMMQNHMMQLLALVAAEPPSVFQADRVRDEKVKLFRSIRPFPLDNLYDHLALGQYTAGEIGGRPVPAYREEPGVSPDSLTPTYATMRIMVDNWRWQGVPFHLTSGKRLARKLTRIAISFREVPHALFRSVLGEHISANRLVMDVQPGEGISLYFQAKEPGAAMCLRPVKLEFSYNGSRSGRAREAYEKALHDCMLGDQTLFWRQDGLEECWSFLDPVLNECESCRDRAGHLHRYPAGTWGPEAGLNLLPRGWPGE